MLEIYELPDTSNLTYWEAEAMLKQDFKMIFAIEFDPAIGEFYN